MGGSEYFQSLSIPASLPSTSVLHYFLYYFFKGPKANEKAMQKSNVVHTFDINGATYKYAPRISNDSTYK